MSWASAGGRKNLGARGLGICKAPGFLGSVGTKGGRVEAMGLEGVNGRRFA